MVKKVTYFAAAIAVFWLSAIIYFLEANILAGILMIFFAIIQYFIVSRREKTLLDLKALFILTWYATMGLAMMRLLGYQFEWSLSFFTAQFIGIVMLLVSIDFGHFIYKTFFYKKNNYLRNSDKFSIKTYHLVIFFTLVSFICYLINLKIVGFIPLFDESPTAYVRNTSKFMTIEIGLAPVSGAAYYCITREGISRFKKFVMWGCLILTLAVYPILNLSRGNFVANVCMFLPVYFYCSKDKRKAVRNLAAAALIAFLGLTAARGGDFSKVYQALQIKEGSVLSRMGDLGNKIAMLYAYLTCSHDNFALNILSFNTFTGGLRMFNIFNEILDIPWIQDVLANSTLEWVTYFLNTHDTFAFFYYDIGYFGIALWTFVWGGIWGFSEKFCRLRPSVVSYMMMGVTVYCVAFAFFTSKTGFATAMWYGTTWLCFLFQRVKITRD